MDSPLLRPSRNSSSSMEVEIPDQNSLSRRTEPLQPAARFAELQLRREKRRTSENKFQNSMNPEVADAQMKACNFCQQLIVITIYDQHVLDCAKQIQDRSRDNDKVIVESIESSQNQDEPSLSNTMETEDNQLQLAGPIQNPVINSDQESPENFSNLFGRFRNPLRNFPRPETSEPRLPNPSSFLSTIFNSIFHPGRNQERTNSLPITESANQPIPDQQQNQPAEPDMFPRGAILVRTIQQGPNGSVIVRMRVIPLNGLFNDPQENAEPNEPQEGRMLGSLLNMLIALHGIQGGGFGDFLNMFQEEKGLEKDVIDSLPLVPYDSEAFKNVDEESKKCAICLDNFEDKQEVRFLWCLHRFHKNCVDQWLDKHTNCPICKKDYSEAVKECESTL